MTETVRSTFDAKTIVLAMILTSQLMIVLDLSITITALPHIHSQLDFSSTGLSWVQNAYALTFGGLLLLGARLGDILGRRRMFMVGLAVFTAASLSAAVAQSSEWLLIARATQGIGAAIAAPSTLALLSTIFHEGSERTRAIASYATVSAAGGSIGLLLGGLLTDLISWRWGFFINVPIGLTLIALAPRFLPLTERQRGRFDFTGAITSTLGMSTIVYGFVRAASEGWGDDGTLLAFTAGLALLAAFVLTELRAEQPITPLHLLRSRERSGAYVARIMLVGSNYSAFFFLTQYMQGALGFSALHAGLAFLPMTLTMFAAIRLVPHIIERTGGSALIVTGLATSIASVATLTAISPDTAFFPSIALPLATFGAGTGLAFGPLTTAGLAGVAPENAGAASGLINVAHQLGGSLGLGVLVTVFAAAAGSANVTSPTALAHGVSAALTGSAVFLSVALAVAVLVMRPRPRPAREPVPAAIGQEISAG